MTYGMNMLTGDINPDEYCVDYERTRDVFISCWYSWPSMNIKWMLSNGIVTANHSVNDIWYDRMSVN